MNQSRGDVLFVAVVISIIVVLSVGSLSRVQTNPPARFSFPSPSTVFVKQLAISTQVLAFVNGGISYEWRVTLTNEGTAPIITAEASLVLPNGSVEYMRNHFVIVSALGPPATTFVRNPPPPFVSTTDPLFFNQTATDTVTMSTRFLAAGWTLPITIMVTYANGTTSSAPTSAQVLFLSAP